MRQKSTTGHEDRRIGRRIIVAALLAVATAGLTAGCVGMRGSFSVGIGEGAKSSEATYRSPSSFENNSTVRLKAARYSGDLVIRSNKVTLVGRGTGSTEIRGDVRIDGNSCTLRALTVAGDVYLEGNNNSLRNVRVAGQVISEGNNNSW